MTGFIPNAEILVKKKTLYFNFDNSYPYLSRPYDLRLSLTRPIAEICLD